VDDNDAWRQMAGDGVNGSWDNPSADYVIALTDFKSCLVASTERVPTAHGEFSTIWALEDDGWHPVGIRAVPRQWGEMHSFNALHAYRGNLLLGAGGAPGGKASLWRLDFRGTWQLFAGYGKNGSWGARDGGKPIARRTAREYVYRMIEHEGDLIVGFGASAGCAQVWRYRPPVAQEAA
jgi:hypothetical protein